MNIATPISAKNKPGHNSVGHTVCPHDCPSACALDVDLTEDGRIGRVRGSADNTYTAGVICAKVARYSERIYHPGRLMVPQRRKGEKGEGNWQELSWEAALDEIANAFVKAQASHGSEAIWPYFYAGTMGQVQRDSIERLRHAKKYSGFMGTICTNMAWTGYVMGTGALRGPDPREMAKSDCVVIWGTNAVATQVNVMTHAVKARKDRGAKLVVIDIYDNPTMKQADVKLVLRPGTDAALACAVMHIAFRDGYADRAYMAKYADDPAGLEAHLKPARRNGPPPSPAFRSTRSKLSESSSGTRKRPSSASATAFPASVTARPRCTRPFRSRPCSAPGNMKAAAPSTTTVRSSA